MKAIMQANQWHGQRIGCPDCERRTLIVDTQLQQYFCDYCGYYMDWNDLNG